MTAADSFAASWRRPHAGTDLPSDELEALAGARRAAALAVINRHVSSGLAPSYDDSAIRHAAELLRPPGSAPLLGSAPTRQTTTARTIVLRRPRRHAR